MRRDDVRDVISEIRLEDRGWFSFMPRGLATMKVVVGGVKK